MLEIACFEIDSAEIALQSVADRIEFCSELKEGGLTPDFESFRYLKSKYDKPIHVMIRSVGGSFFYSDLEFLKMKEDLLKFKKAGADGFVFGILDKNNEIDIERNKILVQLADRKPCVFHRAIDRTSDVLKSTQKLIDLGFSEILTSGGKNSAMEGKENIKKMIENFGSQIHILIGGGVRSENLKEIKDFTNGKRFHSSTILPYEIFANVEEIKRLKLLL